MADELILGGVDQLLRPDAIDDFDSADSLETSVICRVMGAAVAPGGPEGEAIVRRIYVSGYHRSEIKVWVTPVVDGQIRTELRSFFQLSGTTSGRSERFSFIVPVYSDHPDYPDTRFGLRGTTFCAILEFIDPRSKIFLAQVTYAHEPLQDLAARPATEQT